jgi:coatomer subunit zeta
VLYKSESDVMMYVVGGVEENEIMLYNVILALRDSLHLLFKYALRPPPSSLAPKYSMD